jgi:hypothetical protein
MVLCTRARGPFSDHKQTESELHLARIPQQQLEGHILTFCSTEEKKLKPSFVIESACCETGG